MIVIKTLSGDATESDLRYMALVELETFVHCANCGEEIPAGRRAVFLAETNVPVKIAHLRSECARPAPRRARVVTP